jgi:hemolysin activation/secretion protein
LLAALSLALAAEEIQGQAFDRPADERPELAPFPAPGEKPLVLPSPPPPPAERDPLAKGVRTYVRHVRVEGSTVFSAQELESVTQPWTFRKIDSGELQDLVEAITRLYVERGYVSSGAYVPDQDLAGNELGIRVVEARLAEVRVEGNRWHRDVWLRSRLIAAIDSPVNVRQVEEQLQLLLQDPDFASARGVLRPGAERGQDVLELVVEERLPFDLDLGVANDNPPAIGSVRGQAYAAHRSLLGFDDTLDLRLEFAEGYNAQEVHYEVPFLPWGTSVFGRYRRSEAEVVEDPFEPANIESETWTASVGLGHPLVRTTQQRLWIGLVGELRRSQTWLDGEGFPFVAGPDENGRAKLSVLRGIQEWDWRSPHNVLATRSTLSFGLDAFDATRNHGDVPDGRFFSWLGQAQWAHRFSDALLASQLIARVDLQLASEPLLTIEQIAIGGLRTVRGYRENLLVADDGVIGSLELRVPVLRPLGIDEFELAPFFDIGRAWNEDSDAPSAETIEGIGVGARYRLAGRILLFAYWGAALQDFPNSSSNIQDDGFHLGVTVDVF